MLDISRIESQKDFGFAKKPVNLTNILLKNVNFYSRTESNRIIADMKENLPLVNADEEKIGQVIKNLIDNAIKYSPSGGDIIAKAFVKDNMVWISIQDHGLGISQKDIPRVFDKFFRVKLKETAHISGTGLGLSIVKYIVESHDGKLDIKSKLGEGTTIGFGLSILKDR